MDDENGRHGVAGPMAGKRRPWRQDADVVGRIVEVDRRRRRGQSVLEIAVALGIGERTVRRDSQRATDLYRDRHTDDLVAERTEAIHALEEIARLALEAYEHDRLLERAVLLGEEVDGLKVQYDEKGSARFSGRKDGALNVARQALMDIAKLKGLVQDKPPDGERSVVFTLKIGERDAGAA